MTDLIGRKSEVSRRTALNVLLSLVCFVAGLPFAICDSVGAQQQTKVSRIGFPGATSSSANLGRAKAFRQGLREAGYIEGQNILIEYRYAQGNSKKQSEALLVLPSAISNSHRKQIVELAGKRRWPAMYPRADYVEDGGLMTYGTNTNYLFRRAAIFVDKILRGANPATLPVEQPTKFDLVINLMTAKQIGLTIPPNVLARADRVIR